MPTFDPRTYADVLKNLTYWAGVLIIPLLYVFPLMVPPQVSSAISGVAASLPSKGVVEPTIIGGLLAVVLVFFFKVHDLYDSRVVRWREGYDTRFIVPRLVGPLAERLDPRFLTEIADHRRDAMNRLYYHFVRDGRPLIHEHLVARFYGRILLYWICVIQEIALTVVGVTLLLSALFVWFDGGNAISRSGLLVVTIALAAINRRLMRLADASARRATEDEIEAIQETEHEELEKRVATMHERMGLTYHPDR